MRSPEMRCVIVCRRRRAGARERGQPVPHRREHGLRGDRRMRRRHDHLDEAGQRDIARADSEPGERLAPAAGARQIIAIDDEHVGSRRLRRCRQIQLRQVRNGGCGQGEAADFHRADARGLGVLADEGARLGRGKLCGAQLAQVAAAAEHGCDDHHCIYSRGCARQQGKQCTEPKSEQTHALHARLAAQLADRGRHVLPPDIDLIGRGLDIRGITGAAVVEAQRGHTELHRRLGECTHTAVRTQRLVAEGLADHHPQPRRCRDGGPMQPGEQPVRCRVEIQRHGRPGASREAG